MSHVKVGIDAVRRSETGKLKHQTVVILKEEGEDRFLPIWVSSAQADILTAELQGLPIEIRPAPELFLKSVNATSSDIIGITVHFEKDTFYAKVLLYLNDGTSDIRCPLCVALSLAFRFQAPILVRTEIMDKCVLTLNEVRTLGTSESIKSAANILNSIAREVAYR